MTFALVLASRNGLWACTDRQLSRGDPPPRDPTGVKIACVSASDGIAVIAYAGVGSGNKRQVSDWIARLLHGVGGTLDQTLSYIAAVAQDRLTPYALSLRKSHRFIVAARRGGVHCVYSIPLGTTVRADLRLAKSREEILMLPAGYGTDLFVRSHTSIGRLIDRFDRGEVSAHRVARKLAALNGGVSTKHPLYVSPECVVYWYTKDPPAHNVRAFDAKGQRCAAPRIPLIVSGVPLSELIEASRGFTTGFDVGEEGPNCAAARRVSELFSRGPDKEL